MTTAAFTFEYPLWVYAALPVLAALVGYATKVVAIRMMFQPVEFVGVRKPWLGWQGQVPRQAAKMAGIAVDTLTDGLLEPRELVDRIDPDELARELDEPLREAIEHLAAEVATEVRPGLWDALPDVARRRVVDRIHGQTPEILRRLLDEIRENFEQVFDLKHMVVTNLVRDKALLNRLFKDVGSPEMRFMARSGLIFGGLLGIVQSFLLFATAEPLVLPLFGLLIGGLTDWIALQMIFRPVAPGRYLGLVPWQGLFHKRRAEVTRDYGQLLAREILTPQAILESLLTGPMSDRLLALVEKEVARTVDEQSGPARPLVVVAIGGARYQELKRAAAARVVATIPDTTRHAESYAERALGIRDLVVERMEAMTTSQYENLIRPPLKDGEWAIVVVGALLGFAVGELQVQVLLH